MRRKFLGLLFAMVPFAAIGYAVPKSKTVEHEHDWEIGPFYLTAAISYEEPGFYPPSGLVKPEFCKGCGLLRLPEKLLQFAGEQHCTIHGNSK